MLDHDMELAFKKAIAEGGLYDFVATFYYQMSKDDLKEIILAMAGVVYDNTGYNDDDYHSFEKLVLEELHERQFFEEDYDNEI